MFEKLKELVTEAEHPADALAALEAAVVKAYDDEVAALKARIAVLESSASPQADPGATAVDAAPAPISFASVEDEARALKTEIHGILATVRAKAARLEDISKNAHPVMAFSRAVASLHTLFSETI